MAAGITSWLQIDGSVTAPVGVTSWLQIDGAPYVDPGVTGLTSWLQIDGPPVIPAPAAPTSVAGDPTGGSTYALTWVDASTDEIGFLAQVETPAGSGNWVDAVGAANPTAAGTTSFAGSGATPATAYTPRVRSFNDGGNSAWVTGDPFTTDNPVTGGGSIPSFASDANAPGAALVATVSFTPGGAGGEINANVSGSHFVVAASLLAGGASGTFNANAPGATFNVVAWLVPGGASGTVIETPAPEVTPTVRAAAVLTVWPDKDPRESFAVSFTFPGAVSDVVMNVDVYSQYGESDPNPESIFDGSFVVSGNVVIQKIRRDSGVPLVDYYIDCVATAGSDRLVASGMLPVRTK